MRSNIWRSPGIAVFAAIWVVSWVSANAGASRVLWIGDFRGAGTMIQGVGLVAGGVAGFATWRVLEWRTDLAALVATVATVSLVAALPTGLDQTGHLIRLYGAMTPARADRYAGSHIAPTSPGVFDDLRNAIPRNDTYVLHGDVPFQTWARYWLLPRIAVTSARKADWSIFHGTMPPRGGQGRRIDSDTWLVRTGP